MSKIALVVEFHVKPARRDDFLKHMRNHASATLAENKDCLQFDVLAPKEVQYDVAPADRKEDTSRVFLYEMYRDNDVFQKHVTSERVAKTRAGYADMIESRHITRCVVQG
jgi:autoinducer 2-degrading protein